MARGRAREPRLDDASQPSLFPVSTSAMARGSRVDGNVSLGDRSYTETDEPESGAH